MKINVGTFNLNNLFSRFNFKADIADGETVEFEGTTTFTFDEGAVTLRTFNGNLVKPKPPAKRKQVADRIKAMDLDVLAVQEVEDLETLKAFVTTELGDMYPFISLVEGNDDRLIDVAVLSKLPLGAVTSWKHRIHAGAPDELVFSRDLQQVEILDANREHVLFTVFNNHLKSQLVLPSDPEGTDEENDKRRRRQAETIASIAKERLAANAPFIILGDLNDVPDSAQLAPILGLEVVNGLADPKETREFHDPAGDPPTKAWTTRFKQGPGAAQFDLFDQIWLSPALAPKQTDAVIDRRVSLGGDGSDHDPAWVELDL